MVESVFTVSSYAFLAVVSRSFLTRVPYVFQAQYDYSFADAFLPDVYAIRFLSRESGVPAPTVVDVLVALSNLLRECTAASISVVYLPSMRLVRFDAKYVVTEY